MTRGGSRRVEKRLLGRSVEVMFSPVQEDRKPINAMIRVEHGDDLDENRGQIKAGMARSVEQGDYDVDWWTRCHYDKAEERAKAAGRGVWGK
jgi:endonuclease YncB( thermonuclease family)